MVVTVNTIFESDGKRTPLSQRRAKSAPGSDGAEETVQLIAKDPSSDGVEKEVDGEGGDVKRPRIVLRNEDRSSGYVEISRPNEFRYDEMNKNGNVEEDVRSRDEDQGYRHLESS